MPKKLLLTLLSIIPLAACADHGSAVVVADGPSAPINEPDNDILSTPGENNTTEPNSGGNSIPAASSNTGLPGAGNGSAGSTVGSGGNSGGNGGYSSAGGQAEPNGGNGGAPVPEPGTLLLFGTGIAGLAGFSLRRRRRED